MDLTKGHVISTEHCLTDLRKGVCELSLWKMNQGLGNRKDIPGLPGGSVIKNPPANAGNTGDTSSTPGFGQSPGVGNGNTLQKSCLENPGTEEPGGLYSPWGCKRVRHD